MKSEKAIAIPENLYLVESVNVSASLTFAKRFRFIFGCDEHHRNRSGLLLRTLSEFPSTNSGSKECSRRRTQHENRDCCCGYRAYCCCGTLNGSYVDCCSKNHRFLIACPTFYSKQPTVNSDRYLLFLKFFCIIGNSGLCITNKLKFIIQEFWAPRAKRAKRAKDYVVLAATHTTRKPK